MEMQLLTHKYRLLPTRRQHRALEAILEQQRQLYNAALEERIDAYRKCGKTISEVEQSKSLTQIRADEPAFALVQRRIQRETLRRLDRAFKAFFRRVKQGGAPGFPKFKGREFTDGFGFDAFQQVTFDGKRLRFAGMSGGLRVHLDRPLPGAIKGLWFKREHGIWYCGFQTEREIIPLRTNGKAIGVDWGTSRLAVLSSGEEIPNPRPGEVYAAEYARTQRKVSRAKKGSRNRLKARKQLQKIARKVANRRKNTLNKVSKRLAIQFKMVATEEFSVQAMMANGADEAKVVSKRRNREALDAAPYLLRQMISYKTRLYGSQHGLGGAPCPWPKNKPRPAGAQKEDKRPSGDVCSECWSSVPKPISQHWHHCPNCGYVAKRKHNAARVILIRAQNGGGPVPGGAKQGNGSACPGNTGGGRKAGASGRRPSGLSPFSADQAVAPG